MMMMPSREVLVTIVERLKDKRVSDSTVTAHAAELYELGAQYSRNEANAAFRFLLVAPMDALSEHLGMASPGAGELVMIRHGIDRVAVAIENGTLALDSARIGALKEMLAQQDNVNRKSSVLPALQKNPGESSNLTGIGGGASTTEAALPTGRRSADSLSRTTRDAFPSLDGASMGSRPMSNSYDPLDQDDKKKKNEVGPYLVASIALATTVWLGLEAAEVHWPLWGRIALCGAAPAGVMGFYAATRKYKFLRWVRQAIFYGAAVMLLIASVRYGMFLYRQLAIQRDTQVARERLGYISQTLVGYELREGIYPINLQVLADDPKALRLTFKDPHTIILDPFSRENETFRYTRFLEGFIITSAGPRGEHPNLTLPSKPDRSFDEAVIRATYDPTNGLESGGAIIVVGRRGERVPSMNSRQ